MCGETARISGVPEPKKLLAAKDAQEARSTVDMPAVTYGRLFSDCNGRGAEEQSAYAQVVQAYGPRQAATLQAICWYYYWGNFTGNTLDGIIGRKTAKDNMGMCFKFFMLIYYGPRFFLIPVLSCLLKCAPKKLPMFFLAALGVATSFVGSLWVAPLGFVGYVMGGCSCQSAPAVQQPAPAHVGNI